MIRKGGWNEKGREGKGMGGNVKFHHTFE